MSESWFPCRFLWMLVVIVPISRTFIRPVCCELSKCLLTSSVDVHISRLVRTIRPNESRHVPTAAYSTVSWCPIIGEGPDDVVTLPGHAGSTRSLRMPHGIIGLQCSILQFQGWFQACAQPIRDVVAKLRRHSLAERKLAISHEFTI